MDESTQEVNHYAHGKLLLTSEYFVLDGALALALPTRFGQSFSAKKNNQNKNIAWKSIDFDGSIWFEGTFDLAQWNILQSTDQQIAMQLLAFFKAIFTLNQDSDIFSSGWEITTTLEFPRLWGLGSSSTLVAMLSQWSHCNPYQLLAATMGGSGYDLACAFAKNAIFYQNIKNQPYEPKVLESPFSPKFNSAIIFVYLGKKQNSREGINHYRNLVSDDEKNELIGKLSNLTQQIAETTQLEAFEKLLVVHETIVAQALQLERVQQLYFSDYVGVVKSLGAWGGDFVLATCPQGIAEAKAYFSAKGFTSILDYEEMILSA